MQSSSQIPHPLFTLPRGREVEIPGSTPAVCIDLAGRTSSRGYCIVCREVAIIHWGYMRILPPHKGESNGKENGK